MRLRTVLVAAIGAFLAAALSSAPAGAESNGGVRIMPLGDSITDGLVVPGGYRITLWQQFTSAGATVDFVGSLSNGPSQLGDHDHEGHSGWRIDQLDSNIVNWLRTTNPKTVLLHIGTNDIAQGYQVSTAPTRLAALVDKILAQQPDVYLFVATIIPLNNASWESQVRTFNAAIPGIVQQRAAAGKHVYLVDQHAALTTSDLQDGVHPNAGGYTKMANTWWAALRQVPAAYTGGGTTTTTTTTRPTTTTTTTGGGITTTTTTTTTTTSRTTTTTTTGSQSGCTVTASTNAWNGGYVQNVTVKSATTTTGWRVTITVPPGAAITNGWSATFAGSTGTVTATNMGYNANAAGQGANFGFQGTGSPAGMGFTCTTT